MDKLECFVWTNLKAGNKWDAKAFVEEAPWQDIAGSTLEVEALVNKEGLGFRV